MAAGLSRAVVWLCVFLIRGYQVTLGPMMAGSCRFAPTCSHYAIEAYRVWGPVRGSWLTLWRIARCHPLGGSGWDPVPLRVRDAHSQSPAESDAPAGTGEPPGSAGPNPTSGR